MNPHLNAATLLTWFRIAAIPLVVVVFYLPGRWSHPAAALIFGLAALTDWLDGYVARKWNLMSDFGAFLDPVADKLMVTTVLVIIVQYDPRLIIALTAAIIIGRELTVSALREWMAELGRRHHVAVSGVGKLKTIFQMVGLGFMLWSHDVMGIPIYEIGTAALILAAGLTLWSMAVYIRAAWPHLVGSEEVS
ncbi:MAG: CDP-diacylglycerol--glycerol-3-phosphate 3-phosphatidyltransferase [Gammaproteobacteria bacterium]|nr:CDP-diacylglycerol--glycerol-3-phosphate 3-phosphatidyltransferase [Gammaproteobacteria bacterium]